MTFEHFNEQLRATVDAGLRGGKMDPAQIVGSLEIAKIQAERAIAASFRRKAVEQSVERIVPPHLPGR